MLDAGFLQAEDSDRHVSLAIGAIAVLSGPMPDFDSLAAVLAERILSVPRFRQVLRTQPLDLGAPRWADDTDLDISHHVRRAALPRPGDDAALFRWVADVIERRLDRDRPLWECWVIDGLQHNRWAILMKVHHCIADGIAATRVSVGSATTVQAARSLPTSTLRTSRHGVDCGCPRSRSTPSIGSPVPGAHRSALQPPRHRHYRGRRRSPAACWSRAASSLTGPVTTMRRYATVEVSLEDVARVCDRFEVTINDVALAAITDSFRTMLIRRGERPEHNSLRTLVPVSVRSNDAADRPTIASRSSSVPPVEKADPVQQLRTVHARLTKAKASGQRQAGNISFRPRVRSRSRSPLGRFGR